MTHEEMLARIAELEEENAKLRHTKFTVSICNEFEDKHPFLRFAGTERDSLSKFVRGICFPRVKTKRCKRGLLETKYMTDEQRDLFREIVGKILDVVEPYEVVTTDPYVIEIQEQWAKWEAERIERTERILRNR